MDTLTITDLEDTTLESLRREARAHGRTVEAEAAALIRQGLAAKRDREGLIAEARRISAMTPKNVVQTDSVLLIREDRER